MGRYRKSWMGIITSSTGIACVAATPTVAGYLPEGRKWLMGVPLPSLRAPCHDVC